MSLKPLDRPHLSKEFLEDAKKNFESAPDYFVLEPGTYNKPSSAEAERNMSMHKDCIDAMKGPLGKKYE